VKRSSVASVSSVGFSRGERQSSLGSLDPSGLCSLAVVEQEGEKSIVSTLLTEIARLLIFLAFARVQARP
jgi:hypothetical protein